MKTNWETLEAYRIRDGHYHSRAGDTFGMFVFEFKDVRVSLLCVACDATDPASQGFEHVSVSAWEMRLSGKMEPRIPTWEEMAFVKDRFWDEEETVVQIHPPKSQYVNYTNYCLHLWKHTVFATPLPPMELLAPSKSPAA